MFKVCTIALIVMLSGLAVAQIPVAQLPRVNINSTYSLPTGGTTWAVHTAAQLTSALNVSAPGDVIVLDAGVTYSGVFHLPAKSNPSKKWIYIVSSAIARMPANVRVSPASAVNMPKIATPNASGTIQIDSGANHWRLAGLELTAVSNYPAGCGVTGHPNCFSYNIMSTPCCGPTNPAVEPTGRHCSSNIALHNRRKHACESRSGVSLDASEMTQERWNHVLIHQQQNYPQPWQNPGPLQFQRAGEGQGILGPALRAPHRTSEPL